MSIFKRPIREGLFTILKVALGKIRRRKHGIVKIETDPRNLRSKTRQESDVRRLKFFFESLPFTTRHTGNRLLNTNIECFRIVRCYPIPLTLKKVLV